MKYLLLIGGLLMQPQPLSAQPFTLNSSVSDIFTQPAFRGFADRMLPWDDKSSEPNLHLNQIEQLMPYHSHISPLVVTDTLNKMLQQAEQGDTIFYEIYSKAEKYQDPSKQHTGSIRGFLCLKAKRMPPLR
ncbi:hypothetical protein [Gallibacterium anatis]|uniref:hypothetical protein n=1 Tax=Gallibacterium anatis TaxID=750 RepID=UPI00254BDA08|nr:hypothetical protein [Gallibacterium anatis]WIM81945.1 hypothetical protein QP019_11430 [Gallibacterium anatis]